jgi:tetratricopeptide (TPR) repeat protein
LEERALRDFSLAIKAAPSWRAYHNRGVSYAMLNEFEKALSDFNIAIERNEKDFGSSFFNRGEIYFELGKYANAEKDYERAYQLEPQDLDALVGRANSRFYGGKAELALVDFDKIVFHKPNSAVAYADRGDVHAHLQNWQKAAQDFKVAIKLDKSLGRAYQSAAWLMATCPDETIRNPQLAVRVAQKAIQLDGDEDYRYVDTLAAAYAGTNEFKKAQETVAKAIKLAPNDRQTELLQRETLYQAGRSFVYRVR